MLDIRMPIGLMFVILGALLAVYGLTVDPAIYRICLGHNLNLWWGCAMAAFGLGMLAWMRLSPLTAPVRTVEPPAEASAEPC